MNKFEFSEILLELVSADASEVTLRAVEVELATQLDRLGREKNDGGLLDVVRCGYQVERQLETYVGSIKIKVPKLRSRSRKKVKFHSALIPQYKREVGYHNTYHVARYLSALAQDDTKEALISVFGPVLVADYLSVVPENRLDLIQEINRERNFAIHGSRWVSLWCEGYNFSGDPTSNKKQGYIVVAGTSTNGMSRILEINQGRIESVEDWMLCLMRLRYKGIDSPLYVQHRGACGVEKAVNDVYPQAIVGSNFG